MSNLYQLSYISKNLITGDKQALEMQIKSILAVSARNNRKMAITGALLYSGGYFCQVIEGEQENIEDVFETIQMDNRHAEVTVLNFEKTTERNFSEWSMAFAGIEDSMRFNIAGLREPNADMTMKQTGKDIVTVLERLVRQKQATHPD